ncbi:MAG: hypothetical protein IT495_07785 [Gammaproteobacteria bacterium]|nr:hypothetical protein [Gammaproteobacteria bacterium]
MSAASVYRPLYELAERLSPEIGAGLARLAVRAMPALPLPATRRTRVFGVEFSNPLGCAAGFDRDGRLLTSLMHAGFGFAEIGTVNVGAGAAQMAPLEPVLRNLRRAQRVRRQLRIGVSVGTLVPDLAPAAAAACAQACELLAPCVDFLVLNLSRPGSALRAGNFDAAALRRFLVRAAGANLARDRAPDPVPLLVKVAIAPDAHEPLPRALHEALDAGAAGVVVAWEGWSDRQALYRCLERVAGIVGSRVLVAVGGIHDQDDARACLRSGAQLVEVYRALMQRGPCHTRHLAAVLSRA